MAGRCGRWCPAPAAANLVGPELRDFLLAERVMVRSAACPTLLASARPRGARGAALRYSSPENLPGRPRGRGGAGPASGCSTSTVPPRPRSGEAGPCSTVGPPGERSGCRCPPMPWPSSSREADRRVPGWASEGEIAIGGSALPTAPRTSRTAGGAFVPDIVGLDHNPSGRLYRTGDVGDHRRRRGGAHRGRIDTPGEDPRLPDRD